MKGIQLDVVLNDIANYLSEEIAEKVSRKIIEELNKEKPQGETDLISVAEACKQFNRTAPTFNKMVKRGTIKKYRFPNTRGVYYSKKELLQTIKQ